MYIYMYIHAWDERGANAKVHFEGDGSGDLAIRRPLSTGMS